MTFDSTIVQLSNHMKITLFIFFNLKRNHQAHTIDIKYDDSPIQRNMEEQLKYNLI